MTVNVKCLPIRVWVCDFVTEGWVRRDQTQGNQWNYTKVHFYPGKAWPCGTEMVLAISKLTRLYTVYHGLNSSVANESDWWEVRYVFLKSVCCSWEKSTCDSGCCVHHSFIAPPWASFLPLSKEDFLIPCRIQKSNDLESVPHHSTKDPSFHWLGRKINWKSIGDGCWLFW